MEKLFLIFMLSALCVACDRHADKRKVMYVCNDECSTDDFTEAEEFIPGGFWPCDWLPHPHVPHEDDSGAKMA